MQPAHSLQSPIALPLSSLVPQPDLFTHASTLHGQAHVARVMVHAFRLIAATGWVEEAPRLWAAVYLHDIARTHDGRCYRHGGDAMKKFETLSELRRLFAQGGVADSDYPQIRTAVVHHCVPRELDRAHPDWRLTSLLKDADGLDRVRLGDLDPQYLRNPDAHKMVGFAEVLFNDTNGPRSGRRRPFRGAVVGGCPDSLRHVTRADDEPTGLPAG